MKKGSIFKFFSRAQPASEAGAAGGGGPEAGAAGGGGSGDATGSTVSEDPAADIDDAPLEEGEGSAKKQKFTNVYIYDLRNMKKKGSQQFVASLYQHSRSVSSAYFSPASGSRILTTCFDDRIRVFDSSAIGQQTVKPLREVRHNNQTGRWLTPFRAVWVPGRDDLFVSGSMKQPRQIELYSDQTSLLHTFTSPDYLTSICSINAFHPTQSVLAGANSSGKVHVFSASSFSQSSNKKSPGSPRVVLKKMAV
ncbi:WD repeat-containing protein 76 [Branchiostoma belcheri]|nr:WD repeat-containing protein 76 [Branchiostoma belcheri]